MNNSADSYVKCEANINTLNQGIKTTQSYILQAETEQFSLRVLVSKEKEAVVEVVWKE